MKKQNFLMATNAITREHTRAPPQHEKNHETCPHRDMRLIPLHCVQSNSLFPIKQVRSLDLLDGTTESPREIPQKSRRTLMSLQEYEIPWGCQINSKLSPISLHWIQSNSLFPIRHEKWLDFL